MAQYQVRAPDGSLHIISGPDGATPDQIVTAAKKMFARASLAPLTADPTEDMGAVSRGLAGAGKAFTDLGRGAGQLVGLVSRDDVAESRARDAALMKTTGGRVGNLLGNVAAFAPTAAIPGVNTIAGGAAVGAATGLIQPSTSGGETAANIGLGGIFGSLVPSAVRAWMMLKSGAEPFTEAGRSAIVGRAINSAAGSEAPAVANRLAESAAPFVGPSQPGMERAVLGELVPGSVPDVAQAAGNAGVSALQRAAAAANPSVTNAVTSLAQNQNAARVNLLRQLAGSEGRRDFFAADRDAVAQSLYGAARRAGVNPAAVTPEAQANIAEFAKRIPPSIIERARTLANLEGAQMTDATSVQGLHWVKTAVDDAISAAKRSGDDQLARAYTLLQQDLLKGLDAMSPAYQAARRTYAAMSRPINAMDTVQEIANRSVNPLTQAVQPAAFARALNDSAAQRATGFAGATLESTLPNADFNSLKSLLADLQRANAAQNAGRGAGSDTVQKLAYSNMLDQAGVPTFIRSLSPSQLIGGVASRAGDAAYGRANRELSAMLAEAMLDPGRAAELMRAASPQARNALMQIALERAPVLAMPLPAAMNSQKQ